MLVGLRHLFALPTELKANWIFQLSEGDGRRDWMLAVDRSVLFCGATAMLAAPLPLEVRLLGWRAPAEALLFTITALLCYESLFVEWEKLPFTCSYLPNKTPAWILSLELLGLLSLLPVVNWILLSWPLPADRVWRHPHRSDGAVDAGPRGAAGKLERSAAEIRRSARPRGPWSESAPLMLPAATCGRVE